MNEMWLFAAAVIGLLITPGPTNTLLAASGSQRGVKASLGLIPAELLGYWIAIGMWGSLLVTLSASWPWLPTLVRIASALYIAFLAFRMWFSVTDVEVVSHTVVSRAGLFTATLLNPKGLLFATAIFPEVAFLSLGGFVMVGLAFGVLLLPIASLWIMFGAALAAGRLPLLSPHRVQRGAAIVLAGFALSLGWSTLP